MGWRAALERWLVPALRPLHPRECPLCGRRGTFLHFGRPPRLDALCPGCGAVERHRQLWLWLASQPRLPEPLLHFAPEPVLERKLRSAYPSYRSADLSAASDLKLNIEDTGLAAGSVGTVICNHVLEHVDDRKALRELHRILAPQGLAILSVPLIEGWDATYEDPAIADPAGRLLHFGQEDHVRYYGRDFRDRLAAAGFAVREVTADPAEVLRYGLLRGEKIFVCSKAD